VKPRPTFNPWPESVIPYDEAKRSFDAELMAWAAEAAQDAADRIERASAKPTGASACEKFGHSWNWLGHPPTFCVRCGLETHS
jgi:hypothetical protein